MTAFTYTPVPSEHQGLNRLITGLTNLKGHISASRWKFAAFAAAVVALAGTVLSPLDNSLVSWLVLWALAYGLLSATPASPARSGGHALKNSLDDWQRKREDAKADAQLWQAALSDARVMADLNRAMSDTSTAFPVYRRQN